MTRKKQHLLVMVDLFNGGIEDCRWLHYSGKEQRNSWRGVLGRRCLEGKKKLMSKRSWCSISGWCRSPFPPISLYPLRSRGHCLFLSFWIECCFGKRCWWHLLVVAGTPMLHRRSLVGFGVDLTLSSIVIPTNRHSLSLVLLLFFKSVASTKTKACPISISNDFLLK